MSDERPFEHRLVSPPEGEIPPAFTITYLEDQGDAQRESLRLGERLHRPRLGYVLICAHCLTDFGSAEVVGNYRRFEEHHCFAAKGTGE